MIVSYLRVSTLNQEVGRQEYQLDKLNIKFDKEYIDKCTGKNKERPQLIKMMNELKEGDILSIRGYGRFVLTQVGSLSKKGRIHLTIGKYV